MVPRIAPSRTARRTQPASAPPSRAGTAGRELDLAFGEEGVYPQRIPVMTASRNLTSRMEEAHHEKTGTVGGIGFRGRRALRPAFRSPGGGEDARIEGRGSLSGPDRQDPHVQGRKGGLQDGRRSGQSPGDPEDAQGR